ncbi:MAG: hypothetical protein ACPL3C_12815 [Pyrobaculum sp.]|uniref:hypothetical protein n=1 Tax=Pyrobaculum sp. TaxID=2004705 RepID=UPI003CC21775
MVWVAGGGRGCESYRLEKGDFSPKALPSKLYRLVRRVAESSVGSVAYRPSCISPPKCHSCLEKLDAVFCALLEEVGGALFVKRQSGRGGRKVYIYERDALLSISEEEFARLVRRVLEGRAPGRGRVRYNVVLPRWLADEVRELVRSRGLSLGTMLLRALDDGLGDPLRLVELGEAVERNSGSLKKDRVQTVIYMPRRAMEAIENIGREYGVATSTVCRGALAYLLEREGRLQNNVAQV